MNQRGAAGNGKWLVIGLLALGVVLAAVGVKFRQFPEEGPAPTTVPVTRAASVGT